MSSTSAGWAVCALATGAGVPAGSRLISASRSSAWPVPVPIIRGANPSSQRSSRGAAESLQSQGKTGQLTGRQPQMSPPKLAMLQGFSPRPTPGLEPGTPSLRVKHSAERGPDAGELLVHVHRVEQRLVKARLALSATTSTRYSVWPLSFSWWPVGTQERVRHSCATVEIRFPAVLSGCPAVETPENGGRPPPLLVSGRVRIPVAVFRKAP
jgi:hypothetical protein